MWARAPRVFLGVAALYGAIDRKRSPLAPALRSLLTVRVSQLNGCRFCVDFNAATLLARGVSQAKLGALDKWRESKLFDERERDTLDYAEAMTLSGREIADPQIERPRRHYDDDAIVELTALIAIQNMSTKFNNALGVPPQGFCRVPVIGGAQGESSDWNISSIPNAPGGEDGQAITLPAGPSLAKIGRFGSIPIFMLHCSKIIDPHQRRTA